ncbi:hypothetical protein NYZ73_03180 [Acinetobacter baumannii]|nr:hypothetical protein [Acinetobacter baumannii]
MYIYLDSTINKIDFSIPENLSKIEFLLTGFSDGNYILSGNRSLLRKLMENPDLSRTARDAALQAFQNYSMYQNFYDKIPYKIIIKEKSEIINKKNQWIISLYDICYGFSVNGVTILGENLNDSKFLNFAAKHYQLTSDDYQKLLIKNHFHGGGGSTTCNELDNLLSRKLNHTFCFLDSDKESPYCNETPTARKCISILDKNSWVGMFCSTNNYREAENLIPKKLLEKIQQYPIDNINRITEIEKKYNIELYYYVDIKNGVTKKFLDKIKQNDSPKKKYWDEVLQKLSLEEIPLECNIINNVCQIHNQLKDNICQILPAGTQKTLDQTINLLENMELNDSFEIIKDDPSSKEWFEIGKIVFWLSCALPKIRLS